MKPTSAYFQQFAWNVHTYASQDTFGQPADVSTPTGNLWAILDTPSASQQPFLQANTDTQTAVIRVRNFVNVKMNDTLTESRFGDVWEVLAVTRDIGEQETVCEVRRVRP